MRLCWTFCRKARWSACSHLHVSHSEFSAGGLAWLRFGNVCQERGMLTRSFRLYGHVECCTCLAGLGRADLEATDEDGHTPLKYAKTCEVVQLLLSQGANVNTRDTQRLHGLSRVIFADLQHHTISLFKRCMRELVSAGAWVTAEDNDRQTPLMTLIGYHGKRWRTKVRRRVRFGERRSRREHHRHGRTLLHLCAVSGTIVLGWKISAHNKYHKLELVQLSANLDARTAEGKTALQIATENNQKETACQLIELKRLSTPLTNMEEISCFFIQQRKTTLRYLQSSFLQVLTPAHPTKTVKRHSIMHPRDTLIMFMNWLYWMPVLIRRPVTSMETHHCYLLQRISMHRQFVV